MEILTVCDGNTCRSPIAEAILKKLFPDFKIYSAGMLAASGEKASKNAIKICEKYGMDLTNHKSININDINIGKMDLILTATEYQRDKLRLLYPNIKIHAIKEFGIEDCTLDIKDPYGDDLAIYEECFLEIKESLKAFKETLL